MRITCIGTGSSGNCFYVEGRQGTGIFLDAGMPPSIIKRMRIPLANTPVLITHEHGDHSKYAEQMQEQYGCEIYCSLGTAVALGLRKIHMPKDLFDFNDPHKYRPRAKGMTELRSFPVSHNAEEPIGFYIVLDGERLIYLADSGVAPSMYNFVLYPDAMILESNYTPERLLEKASKDEIRLFIAGRVSSIVGHMSSRDTFEFAKPYYQHSKQIILFHHSDSHFDRDEFYSDPEIPEDYKRKVDFAKSGMVWDTLPF